MLDPSVPAASAGKSADGEVNPLALLNVLLRRWRILVVLPFVAAVIAAAYSLRVTPMYTATTRFIPELGSQGSGLSGLAGMAAQLGISLGGGASGNQSPEFYAEILTSREIVQRVLLSTYQDPREGKSLGDKATLLDIFEIEALDSATLFEKGIEEGSDMASARVDNRTNIVELTVDAVDPVLVAAVANRFIESLEEFNASTRQSRARERRRFVEERVAESETELRRREEVMKTFLEGNRTWQQSPNLLFEEGRLRSEVQIQREVFLTLRREYEAARIEEVDETPVFTVIERAVPPLLRSRPARTRLVLMVAALFGMLSVLLAYAAEYIGRLRKEGEAEYVELAGLLRQMWERGRRVLGKGTRAAPEGMG